MDFQKAIAILRPQWDGGYWAKSLGELLWAHQFTVWHVAKTIASYVPISAIDDSERELLEVACLTHDIGKMRVKCQNNLRSGKAPGDHKLRREELESYFRELLGNKFPLTDGQLQAIWDIARTHHSVSDKDFDAQEFEDADMIGRLLISADWIASMDRPDFATLGRLQEFYDRRFRITYFNLSRFPSPASYLAVEQAIKLYVKSGWEPLVVFSSGVIFSGARGVELPSRDELSEVITNELVLRSLALQKPVPTSYTGDFLTLLSKEFPELLIKGNEQRIKDELGTVNRALVFLKLSRDILAVRHQFKDDEKEECSLLNIVDSANSTAAHPKAKEKYRATYGEPVPEKVNRDMLDPLFEKSKIADAIPRSIALSIDHDTNLKTATPDVLFNVLDTIAQPPANARTNNELRDYIHGSVSMEESLDFAAIARSVFDRYKAYKLTSDAEKGVCERCASPVAAKMQPGLNFATSPQAFSQIKPKYQYRAVCPLCGYDNLVVRQGVRSGSSLIFARIENRIPKLLENFTSWRSLVGKISSGLRSPRKIARMQDVEGCENLPFPNWLHVPLADDTKSDDEGESKEIVVQQNDRGTLFKIGFTSSSRGPKDLRGQYEPMYHVLNLLGFQVSLGTEEQDGLFGSPVLTNEVTYLRSLAVVLLANQVDKKSNRFVYASELIERSPSLALAFAAGDGRDRFGMRQSMLKRFLDYLVRADISVTSKKGEVGMKRLLEDAAYLSPVWVERTKKANPEKQEPEESFQARSGAMWEFCADVGHVGTRFRRASEITKHAATKPISQALDQLMLGRGSEAALGKFIQNLSTAEYIDSKEVSAFVKGVKSIIEEAEKLRQKNVTDFLRYKNGLLSAVFMFTRYPDLKSVLVAK